MRTKIITTCFLLLLLSLAIALKPNAAFAENGHVGNNNPLQKQKLEKLVNHWQSYLNQIKTLDMSWRANYSPVITARQNDQRDIEKMRRLHGTSRTHFLLDGIKFRSEMWQVGSTQKKPDVILTYDGKESRRLVQNTL